MTALLLALSITTPTHIDVGGGQTLSVPSEVTYVRDYEPLPDNLVKASIYKFPDGAFLLLNVNKPGACVLTDEEKRFRDALKDPAASQLMKVTSAEQRKLGKHSAFYSEGENRSPAEAKDNKPFHGTASYTICGSQSVISLTLMRPAGPITADQQTQFKDLASSLTP